ncbi:formimidoylglutamase [Alishewanella tabrizica]|uniref:Formimidoylglutamase HutG n=1 Tax=Alishewanella tabrizica TaxID=671278 RepID=A0ABQ2WE50_9ALTE|nr:formimidoylglutamase [Alishewanella tabrizica]GGW52022.1 formimidoylglutamase HutG [Alishewanella tabrizica]
MSAIQFLTKAQLSAFFQTRLGEARLGQHIQIPTPHLTLAENLAQHAVTGGRFVLLGIPEDIGPRANCGNGGAELGWQAFLGKFLNLQANAQLDASHILLLGEVSCADLQAKGQRLDNSNSEDLASLRKLCAQLDERVQAAVHPVFAAGLTPIVIGGGHNNALPLLQALVANTTEPVNCLNIDPHADFRPLEGRHSGNGFSYAMQYTLLKQYFVLGLHQQKNNAASLTALQHAGAEYVSYQDVFVASTLSWPQAIEYARQKMLITTRPMALEVDTDAITGMPASALNFSGISVSEAEQAIYQFAKLPNTAYLHLAEAAPAQHPAGLAAGLNHCGQVLSQLVQAFLLGKAQQVPLVR